MPDPIKHVVAYCMHEEELHAVHEVMDPTQPGKTARSRPESTNSFVIGDATEAEIEQLRAQGIMVEELDQPRSSIRPPGPAFEAVPQVFPADERHLQQRFLLRLRGPMLESRRALLRQYGVTLTEALPNDYYKVEVSPAAVEDVGMLPFVSEILPEQALPPVALESLGIHKHGEIEGSRREARVPAPEAVSPDVPFDLWLKEGVQADDFAQKLVAQGHVVVGAGGQKVRLLLDPESSDLRKIGRLPEVEIIEQYVEPKLHNDRARILMAVASSGNPPPPFPWTGRGQIVAVADTGFDSTHPDFQGRIAGLRDLGRTGQTDDPHGHGTHVAGSILGDGTASNGQLAGVAPGAQLFLQSVLGHPQPANPWPLTGLPVALATLFDQAYQAGARIHNNSWGAFAGSYYRLSSREVDLYVQNRRDMFIVISAGNDGASTTPPAPAQRKSASGFVDWFSLGAPATSKNALTVGASQSDITSGGFAQHTYNTIWPNSFPPGNVANDIASANVSGAPEELAGFSSRGPTDTLQIKPDVVAPGTDIASARSSLAPSQHYSGLHSGFPTRYGHMCGTSMAAPLVSGCAALVREFFDSTMSYQTPSAALVKATLINGTRALTGIHSTADPGGFPNGHQGFGLINMAMTLPDPATKPFEFFYHDNWQDTSTHLTIQDRQRFSFFVAPGTPWLRICLAYTDLPGRSVQNNLIVQLHHIPSKTKWFGNDGQLASLAAVLHRPDRNNNVSIIRLTNPPDGSYVLQVSPTNLPFGGSQDFALVVTGPGVTNFQALPFNG